MPRWSREAGGVLPPAVIAPKRAVDGDDGTKEADWRLLRREDLGEEREGFNGNIVGEEKEEDSGSRRRMVSDSSSISCAARENCIEEVPPAR
jgi:hypothetical protein